MKHLTHFALVLAAATLLAAACDPAQPPAQQVPPAAPAEAAAPAAAAPEAAAPTATVVAAAEAAPAAADEPGCPHAAALAKAEAAPAASAGEEPGCPHAAALAKGEAAPGCGGETANCAGMAEGCGGDCANCPKKAAGGCDCPKCAGKAEGCGGDCANCPKKAGGECDCANCPKKAGGECDCADCPGKAAGGCDEGCPYKDAAAKAAGEEGCPHELGLAETGKPADPAAIPEGESHFGVAFALAEAKPLATVLAAGAPAVEPVQVSGTIDQVCQKKGCWMVIKDGEKMARILMKNHAFTVPLDAKGKGAVVEGTMTVRTFTEAQVKHLEADRGGDPSQVSGTREEVVVTASGVRIKG